MWTCSFCTYGNLSHLVHCQACGRGRQVIYPILIGDAGRLTLDLFSQIIGREQVTGIIGGGVETVRPRHVRFYFADNGDGSRWLMSNLSRSSPVKHNWEKVERLHFIAIQDGDLIELGAVEIAISLKEGEIV